MGNPRSGVPSTPLVVGGDNTVKIWHVSGGNLEASLGQSEHAVQSAQFDPSDDFRLITVTDHGELRMCQHEEVTLPAGMRMVEGVWMAKFSKNGQEVVAHRRDGLLRT